MSEAVSEEFNRLALRQKQTLPLEGKVILAQQRIREWYEHWNGQVYVSFSGGKDSTVLLHLVRDMYPDAPAVFIDTGLEFPEIRKFAMAQPNVTVLRPEMRFDEVIKTYGYPVIGKEVAKCVYYARQGSSWALNYLNGLNSRGEPDEWKQRYKRYARLMNAPFSISSECCSVMKKKPIGKYGRLTGRKPIVGTMASESALRQSQWLKTGCNSFDSKKPMSKPLSVWLESDVLEYIATRGIEYASIYGDIVQNENGVYRTTGADRTGCMFCMFGCHLEKAPNRFQRMKETHPRQYDYCMRPVEEKGLGLREVLEYIGVDYA